MATALGQTFQNGSKSALWQKSLLYHMIDQSLRTAPDTQGMYHDGIKFGLQINGAQAMIRFIIPSHMEAAIWKMSDVNVCSVILGSLQPKLPQIKSISCSYRYV